MNILILNWKDIKNPQAGGAEIVIHELAKRLVAEKNKVTLLTSSFKKARMLENIDGVEVVRIGNSRYTHPFQAIRYYENNFKGKFDLIIECVNTAPYLINLFKDQERVVLFYHQLAREIWFYETKFPLNWIGFLLEPVYTYIQSRFKTKVITVSKSSKVDLAKYGFDPKLVYIITEGTNVESRVDVTTKKIEAKFKDIQILYLGSLRAMKRPLHALHAFAKFANRTSHIADSSVNNVARYTNSEMRIAGTGPKEEILKLKKFVKENKLINKIKFLGRVNEKDKIELMQNAFVIVVPSLKEGWGLIVTEAAKLGTPAIVYDVDGLRDSVINGKTGYIVENNNPAAVTKKIEYLLKNPQKYIEMSKNCIKLSKANTFDNSYKDFKSIIE